MRTFALPAVLLLASVSLTLLVGCPAAPQEIPAELQVILDDPDRFRIGTTEPFLEFAGTPITDANQLAGCWGTYWQTSSPGGAWLVVAQALRYDPASGELTRFVYQTVPLFPPEVTVLRGALSPSDDLFQFDVTEVLSTLATGRLEPVHFDELPVYRLTLGRAGGIDATGIQVTFAEIGTPRTTAGFADGVRLRHTSFECP
jgi:hypothetical protein